MTTQNPFLSRKWILSLLALVIAGAAFLMGKVTSSDFFTFIGFILSIYHAANVVQSIKSPSSPVGLPVTFTTTSQSQ